MMREIIGMILILTGSVFYLLAGIGIVRMPDAFNRIHAGSMATTMGSFGVLLGVGIYEPAYFVKALAAVAFISVKSPIGSSVLARTAYLTGVNQSEKTVHCISGTCQRVAG